MAARKNTSVKSAINGDAWRQRIQTTVLTKRLMAHAKGELELSRTQIEAARILLKKVVPDLSAVAVGQDPDKGPVLVKWLD